ncbi:MAG: tetratricopeptide repeat protein [Phycisphaerae bacterium]
MMMQISRTALRGVLGLALLSTCGCQSVPKQRIAREEANKRWNVTRADVKARLAGDELGAGRVEAAELHVEEALQLNPDDASLKILEARVRLARGGAGEALSALDAAERFGGPTGEIEYLRGVIAQQRLAWDDAVRLFDLALERNPDDVAALAAAAQGRIQLGQAAEALERLEAARARLGWKPGFHAAVAECHEHLSNWSEAADAWRMVSTATSDDEARERYALALLRAGRWGEAIGALRTCLDGHADKPAFELRLALAEASLHIDDAATAREELAFALRDRGNDPRALRLMALTLAMEGDSARALALAEQVARQGGSVDACGAELAATIAWRSGNIAKAREWATALRRCAGQQDSAVVSLILGETR